MAINAHTPLGPFDYTCKDDVSDPTIFRLKGLDSEAYSDVLFDLRVDCDDLVFTHNGIVKTLKYCLIGWKNFTHPFLRENFGYIPPGVRTELAYKIIEASKAGDDVIKK